MFEMYAFCVLLVRSVWPAVSFFGQQYISWMKSYISKHEIYIMPKLFLNMSFALGQMCVFKTISLATLIIYTLRKRELELAYTNIGIVAGS